jgi:RND family efflux transporter MFP subunit
MLGLAACSRPVADADKHVIRPVKAAQLDAGSQTQTLTLPGTARAVREVDLAFRVGGPLVTLDAVTGQQVRMGETIARIDPRDFEVRVATLEANLSSSRASLEEATLRFQRYQNLLQEGAAAQAAFDQAKAGYEMAAARVEADARNLEDARNAREDVVLTAPFSGFVHHKYVENHETVAPGQPVVSLVDLSVMEVEIGLPAGLLAAVPQMADFGCCFASVPEQHFVAHLKEVGKQPNPSRQTYPLTVTLERKATDVVRPGMAAEVTFTLGATRKDQFILPVGAVVNDSGRRSFVWVVSAEKNRVRKRAIHTVDLTAAGAVVGGDLQPGEWVVTAGVHHLEENQQVRVLEPASATNIGGEL